MGEKAPLIRSLRVVFDSNVAVSALVFRAGRLGWLRDWAVGTVVPVVSGGLFP